MSSVLVTGGAGFIGSNFIPYFCRRHPDVRVVNLDRLTYAGSEASLAALAGLANYSFVRGDIADRELVGALFERWRFEGVINFAAETHVDNSIARPRDFVRANFNGTFNLLEAARRLWTAGPCRVRPGFERARFHQVSTDEVYGELPGEGLFTERSPYAPSSPYSATKAGADLLARAYWRTYGLNVTVSNCTNNYGPAQHAEKLIPRMIGLALRERPLPLYGQGGQVRDWIYVLDHVRALDLIYSRGRAGESYLIGARCERSNLGVVREICALLDRLRPRAGGSYASLITFVPDRPGHDFRYAADPGKLVSELGWRAEESFESGLQKTVGWYLSRAR